MRANQKFDAVLVDSGPITSGAMRDTVDETATGVVATNVTLGLAIRLHLAHDRRLRGKPKNTSPCAPTISR